MELTGRTALVTGGAVRVGRAISLALAAASELVEEISDAGGSAALLSADLSTLDGVNRLAWAADHDAGPVDVLVNNASIFPSAGFETVDVSTWESAMAVNLRAPFFLTQKLGGAMRRRGSGVVVNIADLAGLQTWSGYAAHAISKAGLVHLTRIAARALAPEVRVVGIAPGTVLPPEDMEQDEIERLRRGTPLQRIGSPADVASAVTYLIGADFVTGQVMVVDGGRLLK